jgi:hypothetical protein
MRQRALAKGRLRATGDHCQWSGRRHFVPSGFAIAGYGGLRGREAGNPARRLQRPMARSTSSMEVAPSRTSW